MPGQQTKPVQKVAFPATPTTARFTGMRLTLDLAFNRINRSKSLPIIHADRKDAPA